jgi:hypothetical protein
MLVPSISTKRRGQIGPSRNMHIHQKKTNHRCRQCQAILAIQALFLV